MKLIDIDNGNQQFTINADMIGTMANSEDGCVISIFGERLLVRGKTVDDMKALIK